MSLPSFSPSTSPPLVWVTQGRDQHPAFLLEEQKHLNLVEWAGNEQREWVDVSAVSRRLSPRRLRKRLIEGSPASPGSKRCSMSSLEEESAVQHDIQQDDSSDDEVEVLLTILPPSPKAKNAVSPIPPNPSTVTPAASCANFCRSEMANSASMSKKPTPTTPKRKSPRQTPSTNQQQHKELRRALWKTPEEDSKESPMEVEEKETVKGITTNSDTKLATDTTPQQASMSAPPQLQESTTDHALDTLDILTTKSYTYRTSAYLQSLAEICHAMLWDIRWRVGPQQVRVFAWERGDDLSLVHALARRYLLLKRLSSPKICKCLLCRSKQKLPREDAVSLQSHDNAKEIQLFSKAPHTDDEEDSEEDEAYDRTLNLYARLYSRKGPWFRVDDLYKYYIPKQVQPSDQESSVAASELKPSSPSKFFLPNSSKPTRKRKERTIDSYIDQDYVDRQLEAVASLLDDVQRLHRMGFLRSFQDEPECGKTVGEFQKYGLLRQDEQRLILSKLGGKRKANGKANTSTNENLIWKQMCQQQSIFTSEESIVKVLPVSKHVDQALLQSWATNIIYKASKVDYLPTAMLRSATDKAKKCLSEMLAECGDARGVSNMCLRLREAPVQALRRCCRLYLCATSGPGNMRGDGTNGWRSLPESHSKDLSILPMSTNNVPPPGSHSWNTISYPGRDYRFKLVSCSFLRAHLPQWVSEGALDKRASPQLQVFASLQSFHTWEQCVELRANVDYLVELNDLLHYTERRRARETDETCAHLPSDEQEDQTETSASDSEPVEMIISPVDFMDLLTKNGRRNITEKLIFGMVSQEHNDSFLPSTHMPQIIRVIEQDVATLLGHTDGVPQSVAQRTRLKNDCEQILGVIAVISIHILALRNLSAPPKIVSLATSRPWLRHLCWEGCLAYLLWDIIPILEKRGYYDIAIKALETLLFGQVRQRRNFADVVPDTLVPDAKNDRSFLAQLFLSRRARGKAFERLMIDYVHMLRQRQKEVASAKEAKEGKPKNGKKNTKKAPKAPTAYDATALLCKDLLKACVPGGRITFCATRTLARRLKQPLSVTLTDVDPFETGELGHRFSNSEKDSEPEQLNGKYSDWVPITDYAIANSMETDESAVGRRCSYVGFEDGSRKSLNYGSLNVEELAMEYYNTGRLPNMDISGVKGGWMGWHDEGGKVRALFRVLSSANILGVDWGCQYVMASSEYTTIHLTPYQGAPFDLHVGAESNEGGGYPTRARRGFYERRRIMIDKYLARLSELEPQQLSDLVFEAIETRLQFVTETQCNDPSLERDIQQVRSLSLLAAGFGGKMLSAICRCFFFDYRHYSGGLPDLLLVRALYESIDNSEAESVVELGNWVGESFSPEHRAEQQAQKAAGMFEDRDEEFLGCSKVGDSGGRQTNRFSRGGRRPSQKRGEEKPANALELPLKLSLSHSNRKVRVECMLVEVKSLNDRLDPRQEDWLNVLDLHGNARVCKFGKPKVSKTKGTENGKSTSSKER